MRMQGGEAGYHTYSDGVGWFLFFCFFFFFFDFFDFSSSRRMSDWIGLDELYIPPLCLSYLQSRSVLFCSPTLSQLPMRPSLFFSLPNPT